MKNKTVCYTSLRRNIALGTAIALIVAITIAVFVWLISIEPPFFEENAVVGDPTAFVTEEDSYSLYEAEGVCKVALCGYLKADGKDAKIYLTNPEENEVFLRAEIYTVAFVYDESGNVADYYEDDLLGKSGFIRPGEYVETIKLDKVPSEEQTYIMIKIATYNEFDGTSNGSFFINTVLFK